MLAASHEEQLNEALQVIAAIDAHGGTTKYEYNAALTKVREIDRSGTKRAGSTTLAATARAW